MSTKTPRKYVTKRRAEKAQDYVEGGESDQLLLDVPRTERLSRKDRKKVDKSPSYAYLVTMLFSNGRKKTFVVVSKKESFRYGKRTYFLRYQDQYTDMGTGMAELLFHDDHPMPISHEIAVDEKGDPYHVVRSGNVKEFVDQEFVKVMASSQQLSKYLQFLLVLQTLSFFLLIGAIYMLYNVARPAG